MKAGFRIANLKLRVKSLFGKSMTATAPINPVVSPTALVPPRVLTGIVPPAPLVSNVIPTMNPPYLVQSTTAPLVLSIELADANNDPIHAVWEVAGTPNWTATPANLVILTPGPNPAAGLGLTDCAVAATVCPVGGGTVSVLISCTANIDLKNGAPPMVWTAQTQVEATCASQVKGILLLPKPGSVGVTVTKVPWTV